MEASAPRSRKASAAFGISTRKYVHKSQLKAVIMQQKRLIPLCPLMLPLSATSCHRSGDLQSSGLSTKKKFACMTDRKTVQSGSRPDL